MDENVGRKDDKIHKHGFKRIIMLSQDIQLKNSMNKNMCQNACFPCLQETRMRRSKREEQKTDVDDQIKRRYNSRRTKNSLLFLNLLKILN